MASASSDLQSLIRRFRILSEIETDKKFLSFVESVEIFQKKVCGLQEEVCRIQDELVKSKAENNNLQLKLKNARQLLNYEKHRRELIEKEKFDLEQQISLVREMLGKGNIDETKEKLLLLSNTLSGLGGMEAVRRQSGKEFVSPNPLSPINEDQDTMASIVTMSDIDITEEDELEISKTRSGRTYKKSQCSVNRSGPKRKSSPSKNRSGSKKFQRSLEEEKENNLNLEGTQEKILEFSRQRLTSAPSAPPFPADELSSAIAETKGHIALSRGGIFSAPLCSQNVNIQSQMYTPGTRQMYGASPVNSPMMRNFSTSKVNTRPHCFISKTIYWTDFCQPCGKRFRFGKTALKCRDCRATAHSECKDAVPLPCVPTASTPGTKKQLGTIVDYTPLIPPMVPALVIHCTNEVENRGLTEVGIYRVPGAASQVKELKMAFLKGKGMPNLSRAEIHVVCGVLKDFLRSLREPIITQTLWSDFIGATEKTEAGDVQAALYQAISDLPQPNRDTLAWVCCHLQRVAECEACKMPPSNLAKIFGPTIVGYSDSEPEPQTIFEETKKQQKVMEKLLDISSDYWRKFISLPEDSVMLGNKFTPPSSNTRRKSFLTLTPFPVRDGVTPKKFNVRI